MKQILMEQQCEQIAKENFCKLINTVPFVSDIEVIPTGFQRGFGDFEVVVHFSDSEIPQRFCVEVKANGEKRFANMFMLMAAQYDDDRCYVFVAPYISDASAKELKSKGYSYMDLSGNCYIRTRRIIISVSGQPNKFIEKREKKKYLVKSSGAVSAILRTMLNEPKKIWQVKELSEISGKALGTVSNVKSFLFDRGWAEDKEKGFALYNIRELLYEWAKDYHKTDSRTFEFYSLNAVAEIEQEVSKWSVTHDNSALLGGFSAAARYAPTVRYNKVEVYVEPQSLNEFVLDLDLQEVASGGNVVVTISHDETPYMFCRAINDSFVTSPAQTVIDLLGKPGRGEEAADAIILKEFA